MSGFEGIADAGGGIRHGEGSGCLAHAFVGWEVLEDGEDFAVQGGCVEGRFRQEAGGTGALEDLGVAGLVVIGRVGVGDEQGWQADLGDFAEAGGTGAGDQEVGDGVGIGHLIAEAEDLVAWDLGGELADAFRIGGTGDVEDLPAIGQVGGGGGGEIVEAACSLAAAGDDDGGFVRVQPEAGGGFGAWGQGGDFGADGGAGDADGAAGEEGGGGFHAEEDLIAEAAGEDVGAARAGVGIVDEGAAAGAAAGVDRGQGGESAHAEDGAGSGLAEDGLAALGRGAHAPEEADHSGREGGGFGDGREGAEVEVRVFGGGFRIDGFFRDEQGGMVAAAQQFLRHRNAGEKVAAGAAAGDEDVHVGSHEGWRGGSGAGLPCRRIARVSAGKAEKYGKHNHRAIRKTRKA